uniref:Uncharacterized protein n=1 Tax=Solanum tuberosum TaxID=4113 RepID=M1DQ53_SOLTU
MLGLGEQRKQERRRGTTTIRQERSILVVYSPSNSSYKMQVTKIGIPAHR